MPTLGSSLRALRSRAGLTQVQVAALSGLSQGQISRLERDLGTSIRPDTITRLAAVLGVSPAQLFPNATPWRTPAEIPEATKGSVPPAERLRVGFWDGAWAAPLILARDEAPDTTRLLSRVRDIPFGTVIDAKVQDDPNSRPLSPRELLRALDVAYLDAAVIPGELLEEHRDTVVECGQIALVADPVHLALRVRKNGVLARAFADHVGHGADGRLSDSLAEMVHATLAAGRLLVYFPSDVGAVAVAHRLLEAFGGRCDVSAVAPPHWPKFWRREAERLDHDADVAIAVAVEPYLDAWRHEVWDAGGDVTTIVLRPADILPNHHGTRTALSLVFHRERFAPWLTSPILYGLLDRLERHGRAVHDHKPEALQAVGARLGLDGPTILRELDACDFTTRFSTAWVACLRDRLAHGSPVASSGH